MGYSGPFRPGTGLSGQCSTVAANGTTQVNVTAIPQFAGGGGTARIINSGTVPVWLCFWNSVSQGVGTPPTLTFPVAGTPQPTQAGIPAGQSMFILIPPTSGSIAFPTYVDGVGNCDSYSLICGAANSAAIFIQKGEGTGPG